MIHIPERCGSDPCVRPASSNCKLVMFSGLPSSCRGAIKQCQWLSFQNLRKFQKNSNTPTLQFYIVSHSPLLSLCSRVCDAFQERKAFPHLSKLRTFYFKFHLLKQLVVGVSGHSLYAEIKSAKCRRVMQITVLAVI